MAIEYINAVYGLPPDAVTNTELSVLAYLANRANAEGRCWPTRSAIGAAVRLHEDTVKAVLKSLAAKGLIIKSNRLDGGRIVSADVILTISPTGQQAQGWGVEDPRYGGSRTPEKYINHQEPPLEPPVAEAGASPEVEAIRLSQARRAEAQGSALSLLVAGSLALKRREAIAPAAAASGRPKKPRDVVYPEAFEVAWKAYPHFKGRSSKPDSLKVWLPLSDDHKAGLPAACTAFEADGFEPNNPCGAGDMAIWLRKQKFVDWLPKPSEVVAELIPADPWPRRIREWTANRYWAEAWGPKPGQPGCQAPAELLIKPSDHRTGEAA